MKYLIWDFSETMGYREGDGWTGILMEIVRRECPGCQVAAQQIRPFLQTGFPWHEPDKAHLHLSNADQWWDSLDHIFSRAFESGAGFDEGSAHRMARMVREVCPEKSAWRLYDDTLATLSSLSEAGWTHIALTNHIPELPGVFDHLALTPHFAAILNSAQTGYEKPHPQAFAMALGLMSEPSACWMIGDNYAADILGAEAAGIPGILVRKTHPLATRQCAALAQVAEVVSTR